MTFSISVSGSTISAPFVGLEPEQQEAMRTCAAKLHDALEELRRAGFSASGSFYHSDVGTISL